MTVDCPTCGITWPLDAVCCHCGTRLDVPGYRAGWSTPTRSISQMATPSAASSYGTGWPMTWSIMWSTLKNWGRLKEARSQMEATVDAIEKDLERLAALSPAFTVKGPHGSPNAREVATSCNEITGEARSYRSWKRIREAKTAAAEAEWWINVAPAKYHVTTRWSNDWDEWITIRNEHYRLAGLWCSLDPQVDNAHKKNESVSVGAYLRLLEAADPIVCTFCESEDDNRYFLLEFNAKELPVTESQFAPFPTRLWVDVDTRLLVKAEISFAAEEDGERKEFLQDQMFTTYNDRVSIWAPHLNMTLSSDQDSKPGSLGSGIVVSDIVESVPRWGIQSCRSETYVTPSLSPRVQ